MTDKIKAKILEKIKSEKPTPKWQFETLKWFEIAIILILLVSAGLILGFFLWDFFELLNFVGEFSFRGIFELVPKIFLELFILIGLIGLGIYFLYRKTDLPFVANRTLIFGCLFGLIGVFGLITFFIGLQNEALESEFNNAGTSFEKLPFRQKRAAEIYNLRRQKQRPRPFVVIEIKLNSQDKPNLVVENPFEKLMLKVSAEDLKQLEVGDRVLLEINPENPVEARLVRVLGSDERPPLILRMPRKVRPPG